MGIQDEQLEKRLMQRLSTLEQAFDVIGDRKIRHALSEKIVEMRKLIRGELK